MRMLALRFFGGDEAALRECLNQVNPSIDPFASDLNEFVPRNTLVDLSTFLAFSELGQALGELLEQSLDSNRPAK